MPRFTYRRTKQRNSSRKPFPTPISSCTYLVWELIGLITHVEEMRLGLNTKSLRPTYLDLPTDGQSKETILEQFYSNLSYVYECLFLLQSLSCTYLVWKLDGLLTNTKRDEHDEEQHHKVQHVLHHPEW